MRSAILVHVDRQARILAHERSAGAGVIQVNVRQQEGAKIADGEPTSLQLPMQSFKRGPRARVNKRAVAVRFKKGCGDAARLSHPLIVERGDERHGSNSLAHRTGFLLATPWHRRVPFLRVAFLAALRETEREWQTVMKKQGGGRLERVDCNLCGSTRHTVVYEMPDRHFYRDEFFTVVQCDHCGLAFVNPRPTRSEIQKHYPREYYQNPPTKSHDRYLRRRFSAEASYLIPLELGGVRRRLLDVGCANGDFPRFMAARGWDVEGVEVAESSQPIIDFRVFTQEFDASPLNEPAYDAITAWAVLEHVHDPMAYFRKASQLVKEDGLFVFNVPNYVSVASRYLFCEDIPRHLYFFTRETVREYLRATGFTLEKEDNGRAIYKLAPMNWLGFMIRTRLRGGKYTFRDVPLSSKEFRRIYKLPSGVVTALKYAAYSPVSVIDRMLWPFIETAQMWKKTYGVSTYVAKKR